MVASLNLLFVFAANEAAGEATSVLERLEPAERGAVILALVGLVLVGMFFLIAIPLGGRMVRRHSTRPPRQISSNPIIRRTGAMRGSTTTSQPNSGDTVVDDTPGETRA
jgi:hypothetical protein